jgi:hypothetical protein
MKRVIAAEYYRDYKIIVTFNNGVKKMVNMEQDLWGTMFEPLKDKNLFKQFRVDKDIHTIVWPNGADFSPDSLYEIGKPVDTKKRKKSYPVKVK